MQRKAFTISPDFDYAFDFSYLILIPRNSGGLVGFRCVHNEKIATTFDDDFGGLKQIWQRIPTSEQGKLI